MSNAEILFCGNTEYHAMRDSWSHSQVEDLIESPALFYGRHIAIPSVYPRKESKAFDWGNVADAALTHPGGMDAVARIIPESALNGDGHRKGAPWTRWSNEPENAGKILLKQDECKEIVRAVQHCRENPNAARLLDAPGDFQFTIRWIDDETGLPLRCRIDKVAIFPEFTVACDVKTCRSVALRKFRSDVYEYGYHRQAAMYMDGLDEIGESADKWTNIAIGKPDPQECVVYAMKDDAIRLGREENRKYLRELADRLASGDWKPRAWDQVIELDVPEWAYTSDEKWSLA